MQRYRVVQLIISTVLGIFVAPISIGIMLNMRDGFMRGPWEERILFALIPLLFAAIIASTIMNYRILRRASFTFTLPGNSRLQFIILAISILMPIIAYKVQRVSYMQVDQHLSSIDLVIDPDGVYIVVNASQIQHYLLYLTIAVSIISCYNTGLLAIRFPINSALVSMRSANFQFGFGVILTLIAGFAFYSVFGRTIAFMSDVAIDSGMLNSSNFIWLVSDLLVPFLLLLYAQWIIRDGIELRNIIKQNLARS